MRSKILSGVVALMTVFGAGIGQAAAQEASTAVEQTGTAVKTIEAASEETSAAPAVETAAPASAPAAAVEAKASAPAEAIAPSASAAPEPMSAPPAAMGWFGMGVRFGYRGDSLVAGDVPMVGSKLQEQLDKINEKSQLAGGPTYSMDDLNLDGAVFEIVPTFHLGGDGFFTKLDLPIGLSSDLTSFGVGFYPIAFGYHIESLGLFPYAQLGSVFTYAMAKQYTPASGPAIKMDGQGILLESRVAIGLKYFLVSHLPVTVELGYSPFALGAVIDQKRLDEMDGDENATPPTPKMPDAPGSYLRGGKGSVVGLTAGVEWL